MCYTGVTRYGRFGKTPQVVPGQWRQVGGALRIEAGKIYLFIIASDI